MRFDRGDKGSDTGRAKNARLMLLVTFGKSCIGVSGLLSISIRRMSKKRC